MTTIYTFKVAYTNYGQPYAPSPAPTCTVVDSANNLLANAQAVTALSNLVGIYLYSYSGADDLDLVGRFLTTDANADQACLHSYTPTQVVNRLDARVTSRAVAADVQAGLTAQGYTAARAAFLDVLNGLVAAIWSAATRTLSAFGFTVSATADPNVALIKAKTDNLPASPAAVGSAMTLTAAYDAAKSAASQASVTALGTPLQASSYIAPDNARIALIDAKTTNLPTDPADQSAIEAAIAAATTPLASQASVTALGTPLQASNYVAPDNARIALIDAKTTNLPTDPADQSAVEAAIAAAAAPLATPKDVHVTVAVSSAQTAAISTGKLTIATAYTLRQTITSTLTQDLSRATKLRLAIKRYATDSDAQALLWIEQTTGLTLVNGQEYKTSDDGALIVNGVSGAWEVEVWAEAAAMALLAQALCTCYAAVKALVDGDELAVWEGPCEIISGTIQEIG